MSERPALTGRYRYMRCTIGFFALKFERRVLTVEQVDGRWRWANVHDVLETETVYTDTGD